jgi:biopolymer transport protein ExbD
MGCAVAVLLISGCSSAPKPKPENFTIAVDRNGNTYLNGKQISCAELSAKLAALAPDMAAPDICEPPGHSAP